MRVVEDYDVDRRQVQAWRHAQPSRTNHPKTFLGGKSAVERIILQDTGRMALGCSIGCEKEFRWLLAFPSHDFMGITGRPVPVVDVGGATG